MITRLGVVLVLASSSNVMAREYITYDVDDRQEIISVNDENIKRISRSIAGKVHRHSYSKNFDSVSANFGKVNVAKDSSSIELCDDEKFSKQPTLVNCTGFLVAENILATAAHCVTNQLRDAEGDEQFTCENDSWVFDYKGDENSFDMSNVKMNTIYNCKKVIAYSYNDEDDYALIELDRMVLDRDPLVLSNQIIPMIDTELFVLGHPSGLPLKYADGANIMDLQDHYFVANLDTFQGNSGSPVFNLATYEVEGILSRGGIDYYTSLSKDGTKKCMRVNTCDKDGANCVATSNNIIGEHVSYISKVLDVI